MTKKIIGCGSQHEQKHFLNRHSLFFKRYPNLKSVMDKTFIREVYDPQLVDTVIFYLGRLCVEDFMEILLLSCNGYGIGGMKLLRGMFERAVTARYLHQEPSETDNFVNYYYVTAHKLIEPIERTFGENSIRKKEREEVKREFERVKNKYKITKCKKCKTKATNYTWSKLDFISIAKKVGSLGEFIVPAYYLPTKELHSTSAGMLTRLEMKSGKLSFKESYQRNEADKSLLMSHNIILNVLDLQKSHFNLEKLSAPMKQCFKDFQDIWSTN